MEKIENKNYEKEPKQQFVSIMDLYHQHRQKLEDYFTSRNQKQEEHYEQQQKKKHKNEKNKEKEYEIQVFEFDDDTDDDEDEEYEDKYEQLLQDYYQQKSQHNQKRKNNNVELVSKDNVGQGRIPQGTFYSQSISITQRIGPDGKKHVQTYQQNSMSQQGSDGQNISERHVAYKNSDGVEKLAKERFLNGKGASYIQEKNANGQVLVSSKFHNLNQAEQGQFVADWMNYSQKIGFQKAFYSYALPNMSSNNQSFFYKPSKNAIDSYDHNLVSFNDKSKTLNDKFNLANYYFNSLKNVKKQYV